MIGAFIPLLLLGGIGYAIFAGVSRGSAFAKRESLDASDVLKSIAIAVGMFLAMLAVTAGLIDLLQAIAGGDRLSGSNSDLARGLSLLIVGTPVFVLLLRLVDKKQGGLGWSVHVAAALTTLLLGVLGSVGMLIDDLVSPNRSIERLEVAQFFGWLCIWLAYWFGLRPRHNMFGHVHNAIGTVVGLAWLVGGIVGVGVITLSQAYDGFFAETLAQSGDELQWVLVGMVGLAVWLWHWRCLNTPPARGSRSWYAVVVAFAIVPAAITLISAATASIAGTLIWFIGTSEGSAAEWFEPAPAVFVVVSVALAVWFYHRWELQQQGATRNEATRFHDYALAAVGLVGAVAGLAGLFTTAFQALGRNDDIARSFELDNQLIAALTLLVVAATLWWQMWQRIEVHRSSDPVGESDSVWRKLYLAAGAGLGGLTLAGAAVFVVFTLLLDLFDGNLGQRTVDDLAGPLSWILAVAAAVWFHVTVWRADREVLVEHAKTAQPAPPDAPATLQWRWAEARDLGELFTLQRAAFVDEAVAYGTPDVPSLNETHQEFVARTSTVPTVVVVDGTRIVGAVSVRITDNLPWLERLMVAPDRRGEQIGHQLVDAIVNHVGQDHAVLRAVVGDRNPQLLDFYDSQGFATVGTTPAAPGVPELLVKERQLVVDHNRV